MTDLISRNAARLGAGRGPTSWSKAGLLTACAAGAILTAAPRGAWADCDINNPESGETVTCDATPPNPDPDGVFAGNESTDITVNVLSGAGIQAPFDGITLQGASGIINNQGAIVGLDGEGVLANGAFILNNSGLIEGQTNQGLNLSFRDIRINNEAGGRIEGADNGILFDQFPDDGLPALGVNDRIEIFNAGEIVGNGFSGVLLADNRNGLIQDVALIENSGLIDAEVGLAINASIGVLDNTGIITGDALGIDVGTFEDADGDGQFGFVAGTGRLETLVNSGVIEGGEIAVRTRSGGDFTNSGIIRGNTLGFGAFDAFTPAVFVGAEFDEANNFIEGTGVLDSLTNTDSGLIEGGSGIVIGNRIDVIDNAGTIIGSNAGIDVGAFEDPDGDGFFTLVAGTGRLETLVNSGTIEGGDDAVFAATSIGSIVNTGVIRANQDVAIGVGAGDLDPEGDFILAEGPGRIGTLFNSGEIIGAADFESGVVDTFGNGVRIAGFDRIENAEGGVISGFEFGILAGDFNNPAPITQSGDLINNGLIEARGVNQQFGGGDAFSAPRVILGDVTNGETGVIRGVEDGFVASGVGVFDNAGLILGDSSDDDDLTFGGGVSINNVTFSDPVTGALTFIEGSGGVDTFLNRAGGEISGSQGVSIQASVDVFSNDGTITGTNGAGVSVNGVFDDADGDGTFAFVDGTGVVGVFNNTGVISGARADPETFSSTTGVSAVSIDSFVNSGTILSTDDAVNSFGGGVVALSRSGDSDGDGVFEVITGTGVIGSFVNEATGVIEATNGSAVSANEGFGSLINRGVLRGADAFDLGDGSFQPSGDAITAFGGFENAITNEVGALIEGNADGVEISGSIISLVNAGVIRGVDQEGVELFNDFQFGFDTDGDGNFNEAVAGSGVLASLQNQAGGLIEGGGNGVFVAGAITSLSNDGVIRSTGEGEFFVDVGSANGVFVEIETTSAFDSDGVFLNEVQLVEGSGVVADLVNGAEGVIEGLDNGVRVDGVLGALSNAGTITALSADDPLGAGVSVRVPTLPLFDDEGVPAGEVGVDGTGVLSSLDNLESGRITGANFGVFAQTAAESITNAGLIEGGNAGVQAGSITSLVNQTDGIIRGGEFGIQSGDGADLIRNAGLIEATNAGGIAVDLRGGDDQLTLVGGAGYGLEGALLGGDGLDTLILEGVNQTAPLDLSSVGGFEALLFGANADWAFTGTADALGVTIAEGARFSGAGGFGSLEVLSGGIVAPGGSIGVIDVAGDVTFRSGSIFEVEVSESAADRLNAGGVITIETGSILRANPLDGGVNFVTGDSFVILEGAGGLNGSFGTIETSSAALNFSTTTMGNQLLLNVAPADFSQVAEDENQAALGDALGEAAAASPEVAAVANAVAVLPEAQQAAALASLAGQPHAESVQGAAQAAQQSGATGQGGGGGVAGAVTGAARVGGGASPFSAYIGPVLTFGGQDGGGLSGYDVSNRGFGGGADFDLKNGLTGGITFGYSRFRAESTAGLGQTTSNNVTVGARSTLVRSGWTFKAAGAYTFLLGMESVRNVTIGDNVFEARADIDAFTVAGNGSVSYTFAPKPVVKNAIFSPFTFVDYVRFDRDGFTETGASGDNLVVTNANGDLVDLGAFDANLSVDGEAFDSVLIGGGLNTRWRIEGDKLGYGPSLLLGVSYEAGDDQGLSGQQFSAVGQGIGDFASNADARNRVFGRAGVGLIISPKFLQGGFGFGYEAQIDADQVQHILGFRATQRF